MRKLVYLVDLAPASAGVLRCRFQSIPHPRVGRSGGEHLDSDREAERGPERYF